MARETKNLTRLPSGIFQVEFNLPADINALTGMRTWRKSTKTRDPKEAARIRDEIMVGWRQEIERLRNPSVEERLEKLIRVPSDWPGTQQEFIRDLVAAPGDDDGPPSLAALLRNYVGIVRGMHGAAQVMHELAGVPFKGSAWKEFFAQAEQLIVLADAGDSLVSKLMVVPAAQKAEHDPNKSVPITVALTTWKKNEHPTKATASAYEVMVRRFVEANGDLSVSEISRQHVRLFRDKVEEQVRSAGTVKNMLSKLSALLNWAWKEGYRDDIKPVKGVQPTKNANAPKKKRPFNADDINRVHGYLAKAYKPEDDRYWLFTAALLSGLRAEELCTLRTCDVREEFGVWCFDINRENGKFVKNDASVRLVPVHKQLIDLGFLKHHARTSSTGRLFPTLQPDNDGRYSGYWLNQINHVFHKSLGFGSDKSFHSTRHAFQDQLRNAEVELTVRDRLFGHTEGFGLDEGRRKRAATSYGDGHYIAVLNEGLQKVAYPGVDWSVLSERTGQQEL
ncbi:site-specific integrase [Azospirillum brasilense]|uniref:site-specific integrase n=1 Tax=Azospirillum brasilense TaxID=192 RepID=UPI0016472A16|nr:site-specific integrase [Azospirillum brasilense]